MKLSRIPGKEPVEKLSISVKTSTLRLVDSYLVYCEKVSGYAIHRQDLIEQMLLDFISGDKDFQRAQRDDTEGTSLPKPPTAPPVVLGENTI